MMKENRDDSRKAIDNKEPKVTPKKSFDSNTLSDNCKTAESLGDGRWKYNGKTYKEKSL